MQCSSYVPVYHHARDLNVGANGFSRHLFNGDLTYGEGRGNNISYPPCTMDQYLSYDKDVLRKIIQNHDATFRFQVQELHCLYRRQRELMDEIKNRGILMQHLQMQTSESNHCLSQPQSGISQTPSHASSWLLGDCSGGKMSLLSAENIQEPPPFVVENFQQPTTVQSSPFLTKNSLNGVKAPSLRSKKHRMRILDLEIPADFYHDDATEQFEEGNVLEACEVTCNACIELSDVQPVGDSKLGSVKTGVLSSFNLSCQGTSFLIDLNEPVYVESLTSSSPANFETCHANIVNNDSCVTGEEAKPDPVLSQHCRRVNCDGGSDEKKSSLVIDLNSMPLSCLSETATTLERLQNIDKEIKVEDPEEKLVVLIEMMAYSSGVLCSYKNEKPASFGVEILALNYVSEEKDNQNVDNAVVLDCSSVRDHAVRKGKCVEDDPVVGTGIDDRFLKINGVVVDEPSPPLSDTNVGIISVEEMDLKNAPVSAENKVSRTRGKSEDIQIETPLFSEQLEGEPNMELDRISAETLIMISESRIKQHLKTASTEPVGSFSNSLYWFAELVSSIHQENEQSVENAGLFSRVKKEKETGKSSSWFKRDHASGTRQRKDFQVQVLPSLASLSLHETAKDIQTIEAFCKTGLLRRNTSRNARVKSRKCSKLYPLDVVGKSLDSILKQPATRSKQGFLQNCLHGWGKIRKRQEGHRRRASKFLIIR